MAETIYLVPAGAGKCHIAAPDRPGALCGQAIFNSHQSVFRPKEEQICKRCLRLAGDSKGGGKR